MLSQTEPQRLAASVTRMSIEAPSQLHAMRTNARNHHFKHRVPGVARIAAIRLRTGKPPAHHAGQDGVGAARTS
jgi:hypothetical protein